MILEFTKAFGSWQPGDITDTVSEGTGRALILEGTAKESTEGAQLRALVKAESERTRAETLELTRSLLQGKKGDPTKGPPDGSAKGVVGALEIERISATGTPGEDRGGDKSFCLADAMRCVFLVNARETDPELQNYARKRMRHYSNEFTEYKVDGNGTIRSETTRSLANGGIETITRTGTDSLSGGQTYGFTLKPNYIGSLFQIAREAQVFASGTRPVPVSQGNETIWPGLQQFVAPTILNGIPQAAVFGGVTLSWLGETTTRVSSDAKTFENRFHVDDLTAATDFSRDYIVDNFIAMDSEITKIFGRAIGWMKDWCYLRADGVGKPLGVYNCNSTITGGPNSGARYNSNQISSDDLSWMMSHVHSACWPDMRWIANVSSFPQLYILQNHSGTPVFQPNALVDQAMILSLIKGSKVDEGDLVTAPMGTLLGKPIYFSEKVPILGTTGDICAVCPYEYGDATKLGIEIGVSEHVFFQSDRIAYRAKSRFYGRSMWPNVYTQADNLTSPGSGTQTSPCVLLHS